MELGQFDDIEAKVVLVGLQAVGKTSIAKRFVDGAFTSGTQSTVGASLMVKKIIIDDRVVKLQIWDTAGQERFRSMAPLFFRGADAAVVVYDITSRPSFEDAKLWVQDLKKNAGPQCRIIYLVANKNDLERSREVGWDEGKRMAADLDVCLFDRELSAKNNQGIEDLFVEIATSLLNANRPDDFGEAQDKEANEPEENFNADAQTFVMIPWLGVNNSEYLNCCIIS